MELIQREKEEREKTGMSVPAKSKKKKTTLGLNTDEPAQIQPRVTREPQRVAGTMQRGEEGVRGGGWALYSTQSGLQGQLHLRIKAL